MSNFKLLAGVNLIVIAAIAGCIFLQVAANKADKPAAPAAGLDPAKPALMVNREPVKPILAVNRDHARPITSEVSRSGYNLSRQRVLVVEATAYSHTGNRTSTGTWPSEGRTIAVDPKTIPIGSTVFIEGLGRRVAEDTIPSASVSKGAAVDIFMDTHEKCLQWGRREIEVTIGQK